MSRAPLALLLLLVAGSLPAPLARAQQGATAPGVDPASVLATLKDLRARQPAVVNHEKANVLANINAAIADPAKAYEQAYAAVELQGGSGNESARLADWRKREGDLLRNRDFINGLRLQLIYLALSWQHQLGVKTADLLGPLLDYTAQLSAPSGQVAPGGTQPASVAVALSYQAAFQRKIGDTVFATYFQIAPFLAGMTGWADQPFNVDDIYQITILPEMRQEKDPRLLTYWDTRIQAATARAEVSRNALAVNKFKAIELPELLWQRAKDEIALGSQSQGISDMLALLKAHPDHPDFQKWATQLEGIVSPPAAPSPAATP
jgi:hypothetical protein